MMGCAAALANRGQLMAVAIAWRQCRGSGTTIRATASFLDEGDTATRSALKPRTGYACSARHVVPLLAVMTGGSCLHVRVSRGTHRGELLDSSTFGSLPPPQRNTTCNRSSDFTFGAQYMLHTTACTSM